MTLYWWMHWFWITTLKLQVLPSFCEGPLVWSATLPSAPTIQNGHQNGPFSHEAPAELVASTSSASTDQEHPYFGQDPIDLFNTSPPYKMATKPQILQPNPEKAETENERAVKTSVNDGVQREDFPFKNSPDSLSETPITPESGTLSYPFSAGEDLAAHYPLIAKSGQVDSKDITTVGVNKVPPKIVGSHHKHIPEMENADDKIVLKPTIEDGKPYYNPTGTFVNGTDVPVKSVVSTLSSNDSQLVSTDSTTGRKSQEVINASLTSSEKPRSFVYSNSSDEHPSVVDTLDHAVGNVSGSDGILSVSSTESVEKEDANSTWDAKIDSVLSTKAGSIQKNKSSPTPENAKSVANFENIHIEESTKVPSILVQSVIDESAISNEKEMDAAAITAIAFGTVVIAGLIGAISFVLYRRRYLNKPQTLNDKCSNPDSSGYIDDSTLRENSEEMYSLDNDSFLNSLEAMTIQNYWTDNVKHTKL